MANEPSYFKIWENVLSAIDARVADAKREYGIEEQAVQVIQQPARTVVIREAKIGGTVVQASISLQGDSIEINHQETGAFTDKEPETVEIEVKNGTVAFIHDDIDRTTDPNKVADIILAPILDRYRAA